MLHAAASGDLCAEALGPNVEAVRPQLLAEPVRRAGAPRSRASDRDVRGTSSSRALRRCAVELGQERARQRRRSRDAEGGDEQRQADEQPRPAVEPPVDRSLERAGTRPDAARSGAEPRPSVAIVGRGSPGTAPAGDSRARHARLLDHPPRRRRGLDPEAPRLPARARGFSRLQARDGEEALERFAAEHVDLVVLDIMLPKLDGLEVCKRLRAESEVPIIMLTARDDELDKVVGLELGADDYITKPFSIREFRSRVRALLRRASVASPDRRATTRRSPSTGCRSTWRGEPSRYAGRPVQLTYVEFELLRTLACHPGPRLQPADAARGALGRVRLPRAEDDRRARPPSAREDRARSGANPSHPHRPRRRLPLPRPMNPFRSVGARLEPRRSRSSSRRRSCSST